MALSYREVKTPFGRMKIVASDRGLRAVLWPDDDPSRVKFEVEPRRTSNPILVEVESQLEEYFAGRRETFDVELDLAGTDFQRAVWKQLARIPYGRTISYGELAKRLGRPTGARAVGGAVGRNPVSIVLPCHRVVGSNGKLTGFAGGLDSKTRLLEIESGLERRAKRD